MHKKRVKKEKPIEEMTDRELAEHVLGEKLVERLHTEFDLRDTQDDERHDFIPPR